MLIELFVFFELLTIVLWMIAFFTNQEIIWAISIVLAGILAFTSYNVEYYVYQFDNMTGVYNPVQLNSSYPYLMGLNLLFFALGMILLIFDMFEKYGGRFARGGKEKDEEE